MDCRNSAALPPFPCRRSTAAHALFGEYPAGTSATNFSSCPSILTAPSCSPAFHLGSAADASSPARSGAALSTAARQSDRDRAAAARRRIAGSYSRDERSLWIHFPERGRHDGGANATRRSAALLRGRLPLQVRRQLDAEALPEQM